MIDAYAVDLLIHAREQRVYTVELSLTTVRERNIANALSLLMTQRAYPALIGYIAGSADGIVTVNSNADKREILVMDAHARDFRFIARIWSLKNGHYMINDLDPNKQYFIVCRDLPPNDTDQRFEPVAWDYVTPATDLTINEQQELWQSWQNDANSGTG